MFRHCERFLLVGQQCALADGGHASVPVLERFRTAAAATPGFAPLRLRRLLGAPELVLQSTPLRKSLCTLASSRFFAALELIAAIVVTVATATVGGSSPSISTDLPMF